MQKKSWGMSGKEKWLKIKQCRKSLCYLKGCFTTFLPPFILPSLLFYFTPSLPRCFHLLFLSLPFSLSFIFFLKISLKPPDPQACTLPALTECVCVCVLVWSRLFVMAGAVCRVSPDKLTCQCIGGLRCWPERLQYAKTLNYFSASWLPCWTALPKKDKCVFVCVASKEKERESEISTGGDEGEQADKEKKNSK